MDDATKLLEELYNELVRLGHRDDPIVMRAGEFLEGLKPKPKIQEENREG